MTTISIVILGPALVSVVASFVPAVRRNVAANAVISVGWAWMFALCSVRGQGVGALERSGPRSAAAP